MSARAPTTSPRRCGCVDGELARLRAEPATAEELTRAKENLKGRVLLALESTGARMSRLGSELLAGAPLLGLDEVVEQIDAVTLDDLEELIDELWDPSRCRWPGSAPTRTGSSRRSPKPARCHRSRCGAHRSRGPADVPAEAGAVPAT